MSLVSRNVTCEVSLESLGPLVGEITTNLAIVRDIQAVQLVQPIGDWLACAYERYNRYPSRSLQLII